MKKNKLAIAGLGRIGKIHLENLIQVNEVDVVAAMDAHPESLHFASQKGVNNLYTSYHEMIQKVSIDSIVICSPTNTHADYVEIAANAGISVFCEKPLDLNLSRVLEVLKLVKKKRIMLMLGFTRRVDNEFIKLKQ